jgi:ABC-2 type transport system ATP-binding protein
MAMIEVEKLSKVFKNFKRKEGVTGALVNLFHRDYEAVTAVDQISFQIEPGELVGYIGPNGAGKSTTIKMLTGILVPTSGRIQVDRFVPCRQRFEYTRHIGVVFGQRTQLWWDIGVIESFKLLRKVYRVPEDKFEERLSEFRRLLDIDPLLHMPVRKLSLGQRMRCDLVASLLHNPKILFLDEPTIGLDVVGRLRIREFLGRINKEFGTTMILTTHDLDEIEKLCRRVMIIDQGRILYDGPLGGLRERYSTGCRVVIQLTESCSPEQLQRITDTGNTVQWKQLEALRVEATFQRDDIGPGELIRRVVQQVAVHDVSIEEEPIEEIVRRIYENGLLGTGSTPAQPTKAG